MTHGIINVIILSVFHGRSEKMRYIKLQKEKAPVLKNTLWAFRLIWKIDKKLPLSAMLSQFTRWFFSMYIKNILFLKTLLSVIDGKAASVFIWNIC